MYDYHKVEIPANIAAIMMCAIFSLIQLFLNHQLVLALDIQVVKELAKIANVEDYGALGMEMFKVKWEVEGTPIRELVMRDYKNFDMHGNKVGVGQT